MAQARISYLPTDGLSYDASEERYWDERSLQGEVQRAFEICHGCRMCFKYCDAFPRLFDLLDRRYGGDVRELRGDDTRRVMDACFQCKLCEVQCPYTPADGHEFQLDFPKLVHRYHAVMGRAPRYSLRHMILGNPDMAGKAARASFGLADRMNRVRPFRELLHHTVGIHRDKLLPPFAAESFETWADRHGLCDGGPGGEAVLFQTCYVQHNEPQVGKDTVEVFTANRIDLRCEKGLRCCGMPAWEHGDLEQLRGQATHNLGILMPHVDRGAKVVAINPTCSMMLRLEWPKLVAHEDRPAAVRLSAAVRDPSEMLWSIRKEPRFNTQFKSSPRGVIAYHAPCHLRAQKIGFRGRDLLAKLPEVTATPTPIMECCGHDGTFAMTVEGFGPSARLGRKAFEGMRGAKAALWSTDCPLAAVQFEQHTGTRPLHPMTILARAYRGEPFPSAEPTLGDERP